MIYTNTLLVLFSITIKLLVIRDARSPSCLFGIRPHQSLSDLMQDIKGNSSKWINEQKFVKGHFEWQEGYGFFPYSKSQAPNVISYIQNQELHHRKRSFLEEYKEFLIKFDIGYDERYSLKPLE